MITFFGGPLDGLSLAVSNDRADVRMHRDASGAVYAPYGMDVWEFWAQNKALYLRAMTHEKFQPHYALSLDDCTRYVWTPLLLGLPSLAG